MERITGFRARILICVICLVVCFFAGRLYYLQIIETGGETDNTTIYEYRIRVKAARGDILDRNGNLLVSNRASYDMVIYHYVLTSSENPNESILRLVKLCQEQGIEYTDHLPITKTRPFTYTLSDQSSTWQGYFQKYLANRGNLDSDITAPLLIQQLRQSYNIPEEWSDEDARLVLGIRYELSLRNLVNLPTYVFIPDVDSETQAVIQDLNIPGMKVEATTVREYNTTYAAHILGFVGAMDAEQWEYYKNVDNNGDGKADYLMDAAVGQAGLEKAFEEQLHGIDGWRVDRVTKDGTIIDSYYESEPIAGNNVELTIDLNLQIAAEDELANVMEYLRSEENTSGDGRDAEGAAVVVQDVKTGQVLVCASYPTYDLSTYFENYQEILEADFAPLYNRALSAEYPPGSTYKMTMVLAGISSGTINSETLITDKGVFDKYDDYQPKCLRYSTNGWTHSAINAAEALKFSCNYFFYDLGDRIAWSWVDDMAKGLGLGESTGIELEEVTGTRANAESKAAAYTGSDRGFYPADKLAASIGQGLNRFTPMQLCVYASTLANEGVRMKATFLNRVVSSDYRSLISESKPEVVSTMNATDEAWYAVSQGMQMVASESGGTAYSTFHNYPIPIAAKTGTAQHGMLNASDNGAMIVYAPADDPQVAIAVYGEKAGHGSSMAAVAKTILDVYFDVDEVGDVPVYENKQS